MNYSPSSRDAIDEHCREVIRSCLNIVEQHGDTYVAIHKDDDNGGVGYRFNNEGNQVSYRCDVKRVTTINFDRNKIRKMCANLSKKSDETSATLDAALVNTPVEYEAPFNVNETFAEAFEAHMSALS